MPRAASASSRSAMAPPRSAASSRSQALLGGARSSGWKCPPRAERCQMTFEQDDKIRVLIVDDHAVVREGLLSFLAAEPDLEVVGDAESGTRALELLAGLETEGQRP